MAKANLKSSMDVSAEEKELLLKLRKEKARKDFEPKACSDIDDQVKIAKFNELYGMALAILEQAKHDGYITDDSPHYCYEAVMELLDKDIFERLKEMGLQRV